MPASAVVIDFNSGALTITDNGIGDTNLAINVIDFNTNVGRLCAARNGRPGQRTQPRLPDLGTARFGASHQLRGRSDG